MTGNDDYIIEILRDVGLVKPDQIESARRQAEQTHKSPVDVLVEEGVLSKMEVLKTVAMQLGMDVIVLADHDIPNEVIQQVPAEIARRYKVVPVHIADNSLTVALSDPLNIETLDSLRYILKRNVEGVVASDEEIEVALDHYYGRAEKSIEELLEQGTADGTEMSVNMSEMADDASTTDNDAPIIKLVSSDHPGSPAQPRLGYPPRAPGKTLPGALPH